MVDSQPQDPSQEVPRAATGETPTGEDTSVRAAGADSDLGDLDAKGAPTAAGSTLGGQTLADLRDGADSDEFVDSLPDDLDVTAYVGQYQFPSMRRRRVAAVMYAIVGATSVWGWSISSNGGLLAVGVGLCLLAVHHWMTAWPLAVDQTEALGKAAQAVGFPVGHASAQVAWRGFASRPTWRVLLYSAEEPPTTRGLAEIDGVDGEVLATHTEANPEDWSAYAS
ncbi:MAG: hypothetical protein KAZ88_09640 [Acidimicrobiia bacterium]|nr:hypothetical protein [Acidimicrobiia bacterium]